MSIEETRDKLVADLEADRLDLMEAVQKLGDYSARFMPWDELQVGDVVLVQSGLAEVIAEGSPDLEPGIAIRWMFRSLHNGGEYEMGFFRAWLTAVVRKKK